MDRIAALLALVFVLVVFLGVSPTAVAGNHPEPVVDSVRDMLEAGISEDVILAWLHSSDDPIPHPSADNLIALQKAGASETLLKRLLIAPELSAEAATIPTVTPIPDAPKPQDSNREVMVNFTFSYSPWYPNDDEYDIANDSWDFFVYMDGIPVSYVPAAAVAGMTSNLEFSFQQGSHVSELEAVGGNPDHWPPICEEVEANSNPSKAPGSRLERDLRSCASWDDLWNGTSAPPRSEVREALAMFEYRPVPKGS